MGPFCPSSYRVTVVLPTRESDPSQQPPHRVWLWVEEGLHSIPEGLHEEDRRLPRAERQGCRGGHLQEEHQWLHEGCSGAFQGSSILCWRVHGQRRHDYDHGLQGLQGRGAAFYDCFQAWSGGGEGLVWVQPSIFDV